MTAITALGFDVSLYALVRQNDALVQPESAQFLPELETAGSASWPVIRAQLYWLRRRPLVYLTMWRDALTQNVRSPKFLLRAIAALPVAAWFARRAELQRIDHVHAHWATHSALAAWAMHRLTGLPYSITAHAHDIFVDRTMLEMKLREAKFVAVISRYNKDLLSRLWPDLEPKFSVVRCGVDPSRYQPVHHEPTDGPLRLLCVGSLQPYKGHIVLLKALALVKSEGFEVRVTFVGAGELTEELERAANRLAVADIVDWRGALSSDDIVKLMRETDAMCLPSIITESGKTEGIPVALMEAMVAQVPVIASNVSGIPELVRPDDTGLLVEPGDVLGLADAIRRLADPAPRERLGLRGRQWVQTEFNADDNARRLAELLCRP